MEDEYDPQLYCPTCRDTGLFLTEYNGVELWECSNCSRNYPYMPQLSEGEGDCKNNHFGNIVYDSEINKSHTTIKWCMECGAININRGDGGKWESPDKEFAVYAEPQEQGQDKVKEVIEIPLSYVNQIRVANGYEPLSEDGVKRFLVKEFSDSPTTPELKELLEKGPGIENLYKKPDIKTLPRGSKRRYGSAPEPCKRCGGKGYLKGLGDRLYETVDKTCPDCQEPEQKQESEPKSVGKKELSFKEWATDSEMLQWVKDYIVDRMEDNDITDDGLKSFSELKFIIDSWEESRKDTLSDGTDTEGEKEENDLILAIHRTKARLENKEIPLTESEVHWNRGYIEGLIKGLGKPQEQGQDKVKEFELGPDTKTIKLEIYYERNGKDFIDCYYEAPEKLEQRDVAFLMGCFLKDFIKYDDEPDSPTTPEQKKEGE